MNRPEPSAATWVKSSFSGDNGGDCLEIAAEFTSAWAAAFTSSLR
ncbi:DUF397 domain-containing protein [Streptomyces blattellae]